MLESATEKKLYKTKFKQLIPHNVKLESSMCRIVRNFQLKKN